MLTRLHNHLTTESTDQNILTIALDANPSTAATQIIADDHVDAEYSLPVVTPEILRRRLDGFEKKYKMKTSDLYSLWKKGQDTGVPNTRTWVLLWETYRELFGK